jgi:tetratricopeptide (TPR) repeat protein
MDDQPAKQPDPPMPENNLPASAPTEAGAERTDSVSPPTQSTQNGGDKTPDNHSPGPDENLREFRTTLQKLKAAGQGESSEACDERYKIVGILFIYDRDAEAEPVLRELLAIHEQQLDADHEDLLLDQHALGVALFDKGDLAEAESLTRRALAGRERTLGPEHRDSLRSLEILAAVLHTKGDLSGAELLYRRALTGYERTKGPGDWETIRILGCLARLLKRKGDLDGAELFFRQELEGAGIEHGPDYWLSLLKARDLAVFLRDKGDLAGAEPLAERAAQRFLATVGPEDEFTKTAQATLVEIRRARAEREQRK